MIDLLRQRATSGKISVIERIKAPVFFDAVLAIGTMLETKSKRQFPHLHIC